MSLITLRDVDLSFGGPLLLDHINLTIERGERICLIGRNGTGKTTLMHMINGELDAESGEIIRRQGLRVARMDQSADSVIGTTIFEFTAQGLGTLGEALTRYHVLSKQLAEGADGDELMAQLETLQHQLDHGNGWQQHAQVDTVISRLQLDPDAQVNTLSGGFKRRALLARTLVQEPDILLLDEPTNHLDIESIEWLEDFLKSYRGTLLFITHDRAFLRHLATRIIELDRGQLTSWPGDYDTYLRRKQEALDAEASENSRFDKKLAQEEIWIRQGIKARRTRNEGRVRALKKMRDERRARRTRTGSVSLAVQDQQRSGKLVIEADDISWSHNDIAYVDHLSTTIMRGDKIGIIGANGSGKTTLLKLLLSELEPHQGRVRLGTQLEIAYFDQHRAKLDLEATVIENVGEGSDQITINDQSKHIIGYLQDFLFAPERARTPVKALSGGERNRLLLAKLFAKPANLLVMDEPTNDLDAETLELLEDLLVNYQGTLLLVSHDRSFLDNVVTSTLVFEADHQINEYVGGYSDWIHQRSQSLVAARPTLPKAAPKATPQSPPPPPRRKLSYKETQELETLPKIIDALETEQTDIHAAMAQTDFYKQGDAAIATTKARLETIENELATAFERWEALEDNP
jgi:ATP-binding cassette subfamily F protein uup